MSIHSEIKRLRELRQMSQQDLADAISRLEGLAKPLAWQTVQQWEREGGTAPKRTRLKFVAQALGTNVTSLVSGGSHAIAEEGPGYNVQVEPQEVSPEVAEQLLQDLSDLPVSKRSAVIDHIHQLAEEARESARHLAQRNRVPSAAARMSDHATRAVKIKHGDGNPSQLSFSLIAVEDPFSAQPELREQMLYERIASAKPPKN